MALTMSISFWAQPCLGYPSCTRYSADLVADSCLADLSCRSDSNGEDLEGYAGAGLYESITMDETQLVRVDYNDDPITSDSEFRRKVRPGVGM
jgi:alpha-glucan,water dikinase